MTRRISRRDVIRKAAGSAAALGLGSVAACSTTPQGGRFVSTTPLPRGAYGANEQLRVAVLGPGGRAGALMDEFVQFSGKANARIVAVCDLWPRKCDEAAAKLKKQAGWDVAKYRNTEELYAAKDIDALIIGTPDFSHARLCAEAVAHGKDVYVEKPLANVIEDARLVREAVRRSGRIVQVGTQRRSDGVYIGAAEFVKSGRFGKVRAVEMQWNVNQSRRWRREKEVEQLAADARAGAFDAKDVWRRYRLNRAADTDFDARKYLEFRLFWPFSSGLPDQWMSHQIDTVAMITGDPYPRSCVASGGLYEWKDGRTNPDVFTAVFEYPAGFQVFWSGRHFNGARGTYEIYYSNWGTLNLDTGKVTGEGAPDAHKSPGTRALAEEALPKAGGMNHMENWLQCVRERRQPTADIEAGYAHSVALSMAIQALHTGKRVTFDPATHDVVVA